VCWWHPGPDEDQFGVFGSYTATEKVPKTLFMSDGQAVPVWRRQPSPRTRRSIVLARIEVADRKCETADAYPVPQRHRATA
jgi:hypothetical protein